MSKLQEIAHGARQASPRCINHATSRCSGGRPIEGRRLLEAEVTASGAIPVKPVSIGCRQPTPAQEAEILAVVDQERQAYATERRC